MRVRYGWLLVLVGLGCWPAFGWAADYTITLTPEETAAVQVIAAHNPLYRSGTVSSTVKLWLDDYVGQLRQHLLDEARLIENRDKTPKVMEKYRNATPKQREEIERSLGITP